MNSSLRGKSVGMGAEIEIVGIVGGGWKEIEKVREKSGSWLHSNEG